MIGHEVSVRAKVKGVSTTVIDARFAKPLDEELILKSAKDHELMITVEEGSIGGFGSHVKNLLAEKGVFDKGLKFRSMKLPRVASIIEIRASQYRSIPSRLYNLWGSTRTRTTRSPLLLEAGLLKRAN